MRRIRRAEERGQDMRCLRCQGCLVTVHMLDLLDETGQIIITGWRCMNCGDIQDELILSHRRMPETPRGGADRVAPVHLDREGSSSPPGWRDLRS